MSVFELEYEEKMGMWSTCEMWGVFLIRTGAARERKRRPYYSWMGLAWVILLSGAWW